ncbi:MAG: baseplate wedge protein 53 [Burkholderiales bacterium]|nr:baseplate wedge protein 53 [Burkholderiales bacterium]MDE2396705.1 baseplate wedge protein 53 [Burkholderiales bacterium]MDE2453028.1 baseplate wedge protein 53 [Burkholderiales bacterium]
MSSNDPVQMLIDAGAIPATPFSESSRYRGVELATLARADGSLLAYVRRRFIPPRREIALAAGHLVQGGERPDRLANQQYGDPLLYWRIADGNAVIDPNELTDEVGALIAIPVPPAGA